MLWGRPQVMAAAALTKGRAAVHVPLRCWSEAGGPSACSAAAFSTNVALCLD